MTTSFPSTDTHTGTCTHAPTHSQSPRAVNCHKSAVLQHEMSRPSSSSGTRAAGTGLAAARAKAQAARRMSGVQEERMHASDVRFSLKVQQSKFDLDMQCARILGSTERSSKEKFRAGAYFCSVFSALDEDSRQPPVAEIPDVLIRDLTRSHYPRPPTHLSPIKSRDLRTRTKDGCELSLDELGTLRNLEELAPRTAAGEGLEAEARAGQPLRPASSPPMQSKYFGERAREEYLRELKQLPHLDSPTREEDIDRIHAMSDMDYGESKKKGVHLSELARERLSREAKSSLMSKKKSLLDPRHNFMNACLRAKLVPEPLIVRGESDFEDRRLDLSHYKIGDERMRALAQALEQSAPYQHLLLADNRLTDKSLVTLMHALQTRKVELRSLDMSHNRVGIKTTDALAETMRDLTGLMSLKLYDVGLNDEQTELLCSSIAKSPTLQQLNLGRNQIHQRGAQAIADLVRSSSPRRMHKLDLSWNSIAGAGATALAEALQSNYTLTDLNLAYNVMGQATWILAGALRSNDTLEFIDLTSNQMDSRGVLVLSELLIEGSRLHSVVLDENPIGAIGARALLRVLLHGCTLQRLSFSGCNASIVTNELDRAFDPRHLPAILDLDLSDAFDRSVALMAIRYVEELPGIHASDIRHRSSAGGEEPINLVRRSIDLSDRGIKAYKREFRALCREANPGKRITTINDAYLTYEQTKELLVRLHGCEPASQLMNLFLDTFDLNHDGIIEWLEFQKGLDTAKRLFSKTNGSIGMKPVGVLERSGTGRKWEIPTEGRLYMNLTSITLPTSPWQCPTTRIFSVLKDAIFGLSTSALRLQYISVLCEEVSLSPDQAIALIKHLEAEPGADKGGTLSYVAEVLLSLADKDYCNTVLQAAQPSTVTALRQLMGSSYRVFLGFYTGNYTLDLSSSLHRAVLRQLVALHNFNAVSGMAGALAAADTSQLQNWSSFRNTRKDGKRYNMTPHLVPFPTPADGMTEGTKPIPTSGILKLDFVEIWGPKTAYPLMTPRTFYRFKRSLNLQLIAGIMPLTERDAAEAIRRVRFATQTEIAMAMVIQSLHRCVHARHVVKQKLQRRRKADVLAMLQKGSDEAAIVLVQRAIRRHLKRKQSAEIEDGSRFAPSPPFPPVVLGGRRGRRRRILWPLNPSRRRDRPQHRNFFEWCANGVPRPHNVGVSVYQSPLFRLNQAGRSRLAMILSRVFEHVCGHFLSSHQIYTLLLSCPQNVEGCRAELATILFSRCLDPHFFETVCMAALSRRERDEVAKRIGCLNMWVPLYADRQYVLSLPTPEEHRLATSLIELGDAEPGDRHAFFQSYWLDQPNNERPGWSHAADSTWKAGVPKAGVFSLRYGVPEGPSTEQRIRVMMAHTYAGRVLSNRESMVRRTEAVVCIQQRIRGTLRRNRFRRAKRLLKQVEAAGKEERKAAVRLQAIFRANAVRKLLMQGVAAHRERVAELQAEKEKARLEARRNGAKSSMELEKARFMLQMVGTENIIL